MMNDKYMLDRIVKIIDENWLYADEYKVSRTVDSIFYGINKKDKYARIINIDFNNKPMFAAHFKSKVIKGILYFKISYIDKFCINELKDLLEKMVDMQKIIIDLRSCVGGDLVESISLMDILYGGYEFNIVTKYGEEKFDKNDKSKSYKIVLLIGKGTISAAELVAGIGTQNENVTVIGQENTFGKTTLQKRWHFEENVFFEFTIAKFKIKNLMCDVKGIKPEIVIDRYIDKNYIELQNISSYSFKDVDINIMKIQLILEKLCGFIFSSYGVLDDRTLNILKYYMGIDRKCLSVSDVKLIIDRYNSYFNSDLNDNQLQCALQVLLGEIDDH